MKKYLGLMIFVITIFVLSGCMINSYPDKVVYFDDKNTHSIYAYNLKTQEKKKLAQGGGIYLSHKKDRLVYIVEKETPPISEMAFNHFYFYSYNLTTGENKRLYSPIEGDDPTWIMGWSPDDSYIIIGSAIDRGRNIIIIDSNTGNKVTDFWTYLGEIGWLNPIEIIFTDYQNITTPNIDMPTTSSINYRRGIAAINLKSNTKRIIKQTTLMDENYHFQALTNQNQIIISSSSIFTEDEENRKITYYTIDHNGNILNEVKNYKPIEENHQDALAENIKSQLPKPYDKYADMYIRRLSGNWVILIGSNRNPGWEFFIMDKTNPKSLLKFGEGWSIDW